MKPIALLLTILGALLSPAAGAAQQVMTAGDLQQLCAGSDHVSINVCRVYILGVAQGIELGLNIADGKTKDGRPCVPDAVSGEELEHTLKEKLGQNLAAAPVHKNLDAASVLGALLAAAYPCAKSGQ